MTSSVNASSRTPNKIFSWTEISTGVITAIALSLLIIAVLSWLNLTKARHMYDAQVAGIMQLISQRIAADRAVLTPLSGLFQGNTHPNDQQLKSIGKAILRSYPYFSDFAYLRWINPADRNTYVTQMQQAGFPHFHIHPLNNPAGNTPPNEPALIISFISPHPTKNSLQIGANLLSDPRLAATIEQAIQTDTSSVFSLPPLKDREPGYSALMATYSGTPNFATAFGQPRRLTGMFMVTINFRRLFGDILATFPRWGIDINTEEKTNAESMTPYHAAILHHEDFSRWLPAYRAKREILLDHHVLRISFTRPTNLSDLGFSSTLPVALLPWILMFALAWITWFRRHTQHLRLQVERELTHSREQAEVALSSITDAVITADPEMRIQFMNPAASQLTGWPMALAIGRPLTDIAPLMETNGQTPLRIDTANLNKRRAHAVEGVLLSRDGRSHSVEIRLSALTRLDSTSGGVAVVLRDMSRERELETALDYQSTRDPLTGLLNRRSFENYLRQRLALSKSGGSQGALCQIDLNHFKLINDTAGHRAGDELLRQFSWLLGTVLPPTTVLARLGADEFGMLLPTNASDTPQQVAQKLIEAARAFEFTWEQQHFNIGASIGLVVITDPEQDAGDLLIKADLACLAAKDKGRNNLHVYELGDTAIAQRSGQMLWLTRLQEALRDDRFVLYMQPMMPLNSMTRPQEMHEFLLRVRLEDGTLATPNHFIPAAERYQLMAELDRRIIDLALSLVARCVGTAHDALYSINLSGQSVGDPHLANYILDRLRHYGVRPGQICFEITETAAISNMHAAQALIRQLRSRGMRFALDDFGAGLSSFTYLKRLPVDFLKIEGEFVRGMRQDATDRSLVESFCEIGRAFGLHIIAESVEDELTLDMLREIGVDYVQGFHISPPHPAPLAPTQRLSSDEGTSAV